MALLWHSLRQSEASSMSDKNILMSRGLSANDGIYNLGDQIVNLIKQKTPSFLKGLKCK